MLSFKEMLIEANLKLACGCPFVPKGDKFDKVRKDQAKYTHCAKCIKKKFPHSKMVTS